MMRGPSVRVLALVGVAVLGQVAPAAVPGTAAEVREIGSRLTLLVDDWLIDRMDNTALKLHSPIPREVVFRFDAPWEGNNSAYATVLQDGKQFRLYYRGFGNSDREYTCVAYSDDGIRWTRPSLGLIEFAGSQANNIFFTGTAKSFWESHNFSPFIDGNPAARPEQRYKAVTCTKIPPDNDKALVVYTSPDGLRWTKLFDEPVMTKGGFDSHNTLFWDTRLNEYVCYLRETQKSKKSIARSTSKDFRHWTEPVVLDFGDTTPEHFYTNGMLPYPRAPHLYVGLPMRFIHHRERNTIGFESRQTDGFSDAVFMSSHDGVRWHRPFMEAFIRPGPNRYNWGNAHINQTPAWGILQTGPEELSIYWMENFDDVPWLRRGTVRLDGFASVNAPYAGGEFVTRPLVFAGRHLVLNMATSAPGSIQVEIQDASGQPIPGFTIADCPPIWGDEIERVVGWNGGADVSALAGQPVRLRFVMQDADVYAVRFQP